MEGRYQISEGHDKRKRKRCACWGERKRERQEHTVSAMQNDINADSQTAFMGMSWLFTSCQNDENGMAPSLENAYAILITKWGAISKICKKLNQSKCVFYLKTSQGRGTWSCLLQNSYHRKIWQQQPLLNKQFPQLHCQIYSWMPDRIFPQWHNHQHHCLHLKGLGCW